MSGFSTTGSSVLTDIDALSRSMAMWRQFTTWIGGVGIIVLFLAVLPRLRVGGRQALFRTEAAGPELGLDDTIRESARRFVVLYVAITAAAILVLAVIGWTGIDPRMTLFDAVAHAFATIATAGFSTNSRSIEPYAPATQWAIVFFMVVAGTNFALLFAGVARRSLRPFARDEEFRVYIALLAVAAAIVWLELVTEDVYAGGTAVRQAVFNLVTMMTTTGFATADFAVWPPLTQLVLFGVLVIGASAGSTSGSIKLVRHVVIAKMLRREIDQTVHPHRVAPLRVNTTVVDERALRAIIVFVFLYLGVLSAGAAAVLSTRPSSASICPATTLSPRRRRRSGGGAGARLRRTDGLLRAVQRSLDVHPDRADVPGPAGDHPGARDLHAQPLARVRTVGTPLQWNS